MGSNYNLTAEQIMVKDTVYRMAREKISPLAAELDETGKFPSQIIEQLKELGLFGLSFPETYGGSDMGILTAALVLEEISAVCSASAMMCASPITPGGIILKFGTDEQKNKYLPKLASGEMTAAIGLSEIESDSDVTNLVTVAEKRGTQYIINGKKILVEAADTADLIIVFAGIKNENDPSSVSAFILETQMHGWSIDRTVKKMGTNGVKACDLIFEDCSVPDSNRIGIEGDGMAIAVTALGLNCVTTAARALGIAQGALDYALNYTQARTQFGRPIAFFQGIQFMLSDMATLVEAGRYLLYKGCAEIDREEDGGFHSASMAKCFLSDAAMKISTDAVQLLGGYGYMKDHPVERMMRDAKLTQVSEGTNRSLRLGLAHAMLKL